MSGSPVVAPDGVDRHLGRGDAVDVAAGVAHRTAGPGPRPGVFVGVQHGTYSGEDDIERPEDDDGR